MATEANKKLAYTICERWSVKKNGDVEPFFELFHNDSVFEIIEGKDYPKLGGIKTKNEFREFTFKQTRVYSLNVRVVGITADDDRLALEAEGDMMIDGHPYRNVYHWLFKIRNGKIYLANLYLDTLLANTATGWIVALYTATFGNRRSIVHQETDVIQHPLENVWALVSSFGAIKAWMPFIDSCSIDGVGIGAIRTIQVSGDTMKERLEVVNPDTFTISYRLLEPTGLPISGGYGTIRLDSKGEKTTQITWVIDAEEIASASKQIVVEKFKPLILSSIDGLKEVLGRQAKPRI
ncbi:unnamed protein product [Sphagnum balticum]